MNPIRVRLERAGAVESVHEVHAVVVEAAPAGGGFDPAADGTRSWGDPRLTSFWRSSMKPFQALPLVRAGVLERLDLGDEELALACASHHGTDVHIQAVRRILDAAGVSEGALACGPQRPLDPHAARVLDASGEVPGRIHNSCSGKHAGMLALLADRGGELDAYYTFDHPLQAEIRAGLSEWIEPDPDSLTWGVDGCGVPTPRLELHQMAGAYARFASVSDPAVRRIVTAMRMHPTLVSGPAAFSAVLTRVTRGRLLAKEGAEGVFCLAEPGQRWGAAFKVRDGATRAIGSAVIAALSSCGLISADERDRMSAFDEVRIANTRGEEVAVLRASVDSDD